MVENTNIPLSKMETVAVSKPVTPSRRRIRKYAQYGSHRTPIVVPTSPSAHSHSYRRIYSSIAKDMLHRFSRERESRSQRAFTALEDRKIARVGISWARSRGRLRGDPTALAARAGHPPRPRHAPQIVSMIVSQSPRPMYTSRNRPQRTWSRIPDFANQGRRISPRRVACRAPRKL